MLQRFPRGKWQDDLKISKQSFVNPWWQIFLWVDRKLRCFSTSAITWNKSYIFTLYQSVVVASDLRRLSWHRFHARRSRMGTTLTGNEPWQDAWNSVRRFISSIINTICTLRRGRVTVRINPPPLKRIHAEVTGSVEKGLSKKCQVLNDESWTRHNGFNLEERSDMVTVDCQWDLIAGPSTTLSAKRYVVLDL